MKTVLRPILFCLLCIFIVPLILIGTGCMMLRESVDDFTHKD